jgi:pimeloyl-ACP methyl ester carboxylesterase
MHMLDRSTKTLVTVAVIVAVLAGAAVAGAPAGEPCPGSSLTCYTISVPLDHFSPDATERLDVTFGVRPADGERVGTFVVVVGGPGLSGLSLAEDYLEPLGDDLLEGFDVVFFDQRGVGLSGGLRCDAAFRDFAFVEGRTDTAAERAALLAASERFVNACLEELERPELVPYLGTDQAVEDLELFRAAMGIERFHLYGESYGTQYAQTYAVRHPDRLQGLVLDGVVDLTLSGPRFYAAQAQAFGAALTATLEACDAVPACAEDVPGGAPAFYDAFIAGLRTAPRTYSFPLPSGEASGREFTAGMVEFVAADAVYSEEGRAAFLRALAAAARDDLVPLARLLYRVASLDPATLERVPDPTFSEAVFYAVECADYAFFDGTPEERAQAFLLTGEIVEALVPRLATQYYTDLPCVFWPGEPPTVRPHPLVAEGVPTFVLDATIDPATPVAGSIRVFGSLADAYRITMHEGRHVIWGYGEECPDLHVAAFLLTGWLPEARETVCPGEVLRSYAPLAPRDAAAFPDVLEALVSLDLEISLLPEYVAWDLEDPLAVGCSLGGTAEFRPEPPGETWHLDGCSFTEGVRVSGSGDLDYEREELRLEVSVTGLADGALDYHRDGYFPGDGEIRVRGVHGGAAVDLRR